jgi:hypothetical protein
VHVLEQSGEFGSGGGILASSNHTTDPVSLLKKSSGSRIPVR